MSNGNGDTSPRFTPSGGIQFRPHKPRLDQHPTWRHVVSGIGGLLAVVAAVTLWVLAEARGSAADAVAPVKATVRQLDRRLAQEHADHLASEWQLRQELRDVNNDVRGIAGKPALPALPALPPPPPSPSVEEDGP